MDAPISPEQPGRYRWLWRGHNNGNALQRCLLVVVKFVAGSDGIWAFGAARWR